LEVASIDWFSYVKEGGAYCAPLLLCAVYWMNTERVRLLKELKERDIKMEALAERVVTISTEMNTFLFHERKRTK
jgi:hypothetical protein